MSLSEDAAVLLTPAVRQTKQEIQFEDIFIFYRKS